MLYSLAKPILFSLDAEKAHGLTLKTFSAASAMPLIGSGLRSQYRYDHPGLERRVMGLDFDNPVGLAAGFDKDAAHIDLMSQLGFGFIEIGTVTPRPQAGNPKPRLFRLRQDQSLINRMGFNNGGLELAITNLKKRTAKLVIGGNIGKNKDTPNEQAAEDYVKGYQGLYPYVDYFVVNVSSPNTPGLRELQNKEPLLELLSTLAELNAQQAESKPILLKVAPDITDGQRKDIADIIEQIDLTGLVSCNTTIRRDLNSASSRELEKIGPGGLSGHVIHDMALEQLRWFRKALGSSRVIIGVGGIDSPMRAGAMLAAGADLIQIYSGLIYQGPQLIKRIKKSLVYKG